MISKYENLKKSGLNYLGEIPSHWKVVKLKYIGDSITGITYSPNDIVYENGDESKLVLRSSNIQNGKLSLDNNVFVDKTISDKYVARKGDILICSRNGSRALIGKNIKIDDKLEGQTWGAFMTVFRTDHSNFVYYFFNSPIFTALSSLFLTSTINQLTIGVINNFTLALPPKEEQTKIAQYLDHQTELIDSIIEKKQQLIEKLKEQRQAIINEAVTKGLDPDAPMKDSGVEWLRATPEHWISSKIKFVTTIFGRIGFRGYTKEDLVLEGEGALTLGAKHIDKNNNLDIKDPEYISWDKYYESPEIMVKQGDVIFTQRGSLGKVCHINNEIPPATINPSMVLFKDISISNRFLYFWLCSDRIQNEVKLLQANTAVPMISQFQLGNFPILLPSIEEQLIIVDFLDKSLGRIDEVLDKNQSFLQKMKLFRQSIISEAVTGKIDVREWQPKTVETV